MRKIKAVTAAVLTGIGISAAVLMAPSAGAWDCTGGGLGTLGSGEGCVDYRADGSVWWKDSGCAFGVCWWGPWYPAPPP